MNASQRIVAELQGFTELGMKREALELTRKCLKRQHVAPEVFCSAVNAVLTQADRLARWRTLVESGLRRLPTKSHSRVRFMMLAYYCSLPDYPAAKEFIPKAFKGEFALVELAFALEAMASTKRLSEAKLLAKKSVRAMRQECPPVMQAILLRGLAIYFTVTRDWDTALALWQQLLAEDQLREDAIFESVLIRMAQAVEAVEQGIHLLERGPGRGDVSESTKRGPKASEHSPATKLRIYKSMLCRMLPARFKAGD